MNLFLDIETLGTNRDDVRDYIAKTIKPPGTISKPETIAKWETESKPQAIEEAIAKTSLDGSFGRVCVIGWALNDEGPCSLDSDDNEARLLHLFAMKLDSLIPKNQQFSTAIIGHNVSSFDLRFLLQRYIVNGIRPPVVITRAAQAKPWEADKVYDTMIQWAGVGNRISLEKLCLALSIPSPKHGMDGSQVAGYVADGRIKEVAEYCRGDVEATRQAWRKMTFHEELQAA